MKQLRVSVATALFTCGVALSAAGAQGRGNPPHRDDHQRGVSPQEQQRRIDEQKKRDDDYRRTLSEQTRTEQSRAAQLQQERRPAQTTLHEQYLRNLQQQQQRLQAQRDYSRDPYYSAPVNYRYRLNGAYHETNQYGADALRRAVQNGYQQGYQAGAADRQDRWRSNYQQSYAYQDATYGYDGSYVPLADYSYYFRQGFQRGYEDGYANASRYGSYSNGTPTILGNILSTILGLTSIH